MPYFPTHINSYTEMGSRELMDTIVVVAIRNLAAKEALERGAGKSVKCWKQGIELSIEGS
jgi:hypothetical protein